MTSDKQIAQSLAQQTVKNYNLGSEGIVKYINTIFEPNKSTFIEKVKIYYPLYAQSVIEFLDEYQNALAEMSNDKKKVAQTEVPEQATALPAGSSVGTAQQTMVPV